MNVVAINGSPKSDGNTAQTIAMVAAELEKEGIGTQVLHIGNKAIRGCVGCGKCAKNRNEECILGGDEVNEYIQIMKQADGIILGSPVYYAAIAGTMKCFLDRVFYVSTFNKNLFRHKVGASVVAVRRAGGLPALNELNTYLLYSEMLIASSNYWNAIYGARPGEVARDEEGGQIMRVLGRNMAWMMKLVEHGKGAVAEPEMEGKVYMNFIR